MRYLLLVWLALVACRPTSSRADPPVNLQRDQLVAWCIVPFDARNRSPAERAEMLEKLGLKRVAYDWREQHVASFEEEIRQYQARGIEYFAFWGSHDTAFALFEKYKLHPQIWQMLAAPHGETDEERVRNAAEQILPLVERTRAMGCRLGLYNHGGWQGEPANMTAVCRYLREHHNAEHVGIVYNLHHGHGHMEDFAEVLALMKPYLLCLNLNGMTADGEARGLKILPLGEGEADLRLLKIIQSSGYDGPLGIIGHTQDDVEQRLLDNLEGLDWLRPQLEGRPAGPKPQLRTWTPVLAVSAAAVVPGALLEGNPDYRQPPLTVEVRATLSDKSGYNILVASDTKQSGDHWEVFTMAGSGMLTAYLPGMTPDHVRSEAMVCDGQPHTLTMLYEPSRVRLLLDGRVVADQVFESSGRAALPGGLGIGRLVEGGLGCRGEIEWVRLSRGVRDLNGSPADVDQDDATLLLWRNIVPKKDSATSRSSYRPELNGVAAEYSPALISELIQTAHDQGDPHRGLMVFSSAKSACLSCHKVGRHGGRVGPDLATLIPQRKSEEFVESLLWPKRQVKPEFVAHLVIDARGRSHQGYLVREDAQHIVLKDPTRPNDPEIVIPRDEIELSREVGTLMPDNLTAAMSDQQLADLVCFLITLGHDGGVPTAEIDELLVHAQAHLHGPAKFPWDRAPLHPLQWPNHTAAVNSERLYDFYAREADYFRAQPQRPALVMEYPGLDGGEFGHWGNQNEQTWASDRWNFTILGSVQCGVFRGAGETIPRGICVRVGANQELSACFNAETQQYDLVWKDGFVNFSSVRHGFMEGVRLVGTPVDADGLTAGTGGTKYRGFYRSGAKVAFSSVVEGVEYLNVPDVVDGRFTHSIGPALTHKQRELFGNPAPQWPEVIETPIEHGDGQPYAVDTIGLPWENPWNALLFCGGHAFLPDGSALVCTMQGDVWRVSDFAYPSRTAKWRRFAAGLHHPLGLWIDDDGIFVLGRDQITRLHDRNHDGEADFYECFSNAFQTSPAGHDFICGLERDATGYFYTASGNQGVVRISPDGQRAEVIATGFRNPDGLGLLPDGTVTVPCSEGEWTPASMICAVRPRKDSTSVPHFGYRGPVNGQVPELPLAYLPRGVDNSAGGQIVVDSHRWGPLTGQLLHFSFGASSHFLVLRDEVGGQLQGAIVPLPGDFRSGVHRGRFSPTDGQLYVTGMQGWGGYIVDDGCFQRVRYTGDPVQLPVGFHVHENGVAVTFPGPLDAATAGEPRSHFAHCWNYRYGPGYGSAEFSTQHFGMRGHDVLAIPDVHLLDGGRTLFIELPELQPVNQLHLRLQTSPGAFHDLFVTIHKLDSPRSDLPGYVAVRKEILPHPILADLALATRSVPNPHRHKINDARSIRIETGSNLSFAQRSVAAKPGEPLALTLANPDVVPHNWALVKPGTLDRVGSLADRLIADPEAALRQYVPDTTDVLAYTDIVLPSEEFTIYFRAPRESGRYPFLCTFPGHWKVMNGELVVGE